MENAKQPSGVTFDIVLDENVAGCEPKRMSLLKNRLNKKETLTADEIEKKQMQAEERRKARIEARIRRMHEREESTRKLVTNVDMLLQQQSLRSGEAGTSGSDVPVMSSREILKTANNVVREFKNMQQQLLNMDLKVDERKRQVPCIPETKWQKALKSSRKCRSTQSMAKRSSVVPKESKLGQKTEGIAFEIPLDDSKEAKGGRKPAIACLQKKQCSADTCEMAAIQLEEKQRRAAERRQKRQEDKVRRTRESREALMELRSKVNIFQQHQAALDGKADPDKKLSRGEAVRLAHDIADGFSNIHSRYESDLERAEGFFMVYGNNMS